MKKTFIIGAIFGVIASVLGLFVGLQISPVLANILLFPLLIISKIVQQPLGEWSIFLRIISLLFSMLLWGLVFSGITQLLSKLKK